MQMQHNIKRTGKLESVVGLLLAQLTQQAGRPKQWITN